MIANDYPSVAGGTLSVIQLIIFELVAKIVHVKMGYMSTGNLKEGMINQYIAAISGSLAYAVVGAATGWPSPVLIEMANGETPLELNLTQTSWMVSLMFLGHISSPIPAGYLMHSFGRKKVCLYLSIFPLLSWLLIYYANHAAYLYIARYLAGVWIGITSTIMPIYVGEISSTALRSSLTTINNLMTNFGILFAYVVGPYVNYFMFAVICEIMTVVYICTFLMMPESPHYFLQFGQREEALTALRWLRKGETEENIEKEVKIIEQAIEQQRLQKGSVKDIFYHKANRKGFALSVTYAIFKRLSGSGVMQAYLSVTLPAVSVGVLNPDNSVIIIGLTSFISSIFSTGLAVKYRRRILLTISCGGCSIATGLVALWFYLNEFSTIDVTRYSDVIFWSVFFYYCVFNIGLGPIGTSIKGEVLPSSVRALSSSLVTFAVAFTAFFLNKYYLIVAHSFGMYVNYIVFSVACAATVVYTWTYAPETHKKSMEEIQEILKGNKKLRNYTVTV